MEPVSPPHNKLEPGVFQGTPASAQKPKDDTPSAPRIIRTMKNDAAEAIKRQNETSVSIALAEEKKVARARAEAALAKQAQGETTGPAPKRIGRFFIVTGMALVIVAAILAYLFILPKLKDVSVITPSVPSSSKPVDTAPMTTAPKLAPIASSLVPAQTEKRFNITKETPSQIFTAIAKERRQGNSAGSIKNFYFTEEVGSDSTVIPASRLLSFANISAPEILTRSLEKSFMAGFFGEADGGATPFLIFKVSSYDTGLAGMLEWEANLPSSFDTIFGTSVDSGVLSKTKFRDITVLGKDARIIDTALGDTIAYAFTNQNTIVIAGSKTALEALIPIAGKN